jgi:hypothetical protein
MSSTSENRESALTPQIILTALAIVTRTKNDITEYCTLLERESTLDDDTKTELNTSRNSMISMSDAGGNKVFRAAIEIAAFAKRDWDYISREAYRMEVRALEGDQRKEVESFLVETARDYPELWSSIEEKSEVSTKSGKKLTFAPKESLRKVQ